MSKLLQAVKEYIEQEKTMLELSKKEVYGFSDDFSVGYHEGREAMRATFIEELEELLKEVQCIR